MSERTSVAVIGASGYTGAELVRLLLSHPHVQLSCVVAGRSAGQAMDAVFPQFVGRFDSVLEQFDADEVARRATVAFTALPHAASAEVVAALRTRGVTVVDLSADFRLSDLATYERYYSSHPCPDLVAQAVYGLPELHRERIRGARLVAAPGCYPTATVLAIAPLLRAGVVEAVGLVVDAKSGVTGAGRNPSLAVHFAEVAEGVRAYKVGGSHRHAPEIRQELGQVAGRDVRLSFTPHLVPMSRGILSNVYAQPCPGVQAADLRKALQDAYGDEPFVRVLPEGQAPDTRSVRGSNRVQVQVWLDEDAQQVIAMSAIDNLVKGASGQAVQCLNLMQGWSETAGLGD